MNRNEVVRLLVLNEIMDDYENVDQMILKGVTELGAKLGWSIDRTEVVNALAELIQQGLAKAYDLSSPPPHIPLQGMPAMDVVENMTDEVFHTYFYVTPAGMEYHLAEDMPWPFDDDENVIESVLREELPKPPAKLNYPDSKQ